MEIQNNSYQAQVPAYSSGDIDEYAQETQYGSRFSSGSTKRSSFRFLRCLFILVIISLLAAVGLKAYSIYQNEGFLVKLQQIQDSISQKLYGSDLPSQNSQVSSEQQPKQAQSIAQESQSDLNLNQPLVAQAQQEQVPIYSENQMSGDQSIEQINDVEQANEDNLVNEEASNQQNQKNQAVTQENQNNQISHTQQVFLVRQDRNQKNSPNEINNKNQNNEVDQRDQNNQNQVNDQGQQISNQLDQTTQPIEKAQRNKNNPIEEETNNEINDNGNISNADNGIDLEQQIEEIQVAVEQLQELEDELIEEKQAQTNKKL